MVVDGKINQKYDTILIPFYSPDSNHLAYVVKKADKWLVIRDGIEGTPYDKVTEPIFSPDSRRMLYMAYKNNKWRMVVDGKERKAYDGVSIPAFSPDSRHLAYAACVDEEEALNRLGAIVKGSRFVFTDTRRWLWLTRDFSFTRLKSGNDLSDRKCAADINSLEIE